MHPSVALAKVVEVSGDPHIFLTVLDDLVDFAEPPPLERLHPVRTLALAEGCRSDAVELRPEAEAFLEVEHQVEGRELLEVFLGVGAEDLIVKTADVVADDQGGIDKELDELRDRFLVDDQELIAIIAVAPSTDPDDRSIPAVMITCVTPSAMIPTMAT